MLPVYNSNEVKKFGIRIRHGENIKGQIPQESTKKGEALQFHPL
ncbi:hypothetical protein B14911_03409 [Bacillus sp. NRRL B-14911]|nr:hypothetical protein B14911_03409 [Bacillus sp. NRRL B-14911]